jgi:hypothetical protein
MLTDDKLIQKKRNRVKVKRGRRDQEVKMLKVKKKWEK